MESSPLVKAHDHARAAAIATQTADTTVAINEHAHAAGEFANASRTTSSIEALRTLTLLEQHHRRLSELLKLPVGPPSQNSADGDIPGEEDEKEPQGQDADSKSALPPTKASPTGRQSAAPAKPPPGISHKRYPGRNLSSSIASNLASARGIRAHYSTQPLSPSVSNDQAPGSVEVHPRRERKEGSGSTRSKAPDQLEHSRKPSWVPPVIQEDAVDEPVTSEPSSQPQSEEGFSRFYSTFGNLFNRIPLPLVFSGFPLSPEEAPAPLSPPASEPAPKKSRHRSSAAAAEPDLSRIYSRATLRSLEREGHGPNDSFYVVPTSGHTASYASILNHERKEKRRLAASIHRGHEESNQCHAPGADNVLEEDDEDDDDFVDARESQQAGAAQGPIAGHGSSVRKRFGGGKSRSHPSDNELRNAVEELQIENASLKDVLDKLSKRLHAFELNSQSSHLALAQSLRLQRPGSPLSSSSAGGGGVGAVTGEEALRRRNRELEEQLGEMVKRMSGLEKDHIKLQLTVEKYRTRWEKLKAGAKARIEAQELANGGAARR